MSEPSRDGESVRIIDADAAADAGAVSAHDAALLEVARGLAAAADIREVTRSIVAAAIRLTRAFGAYVEGVRQGDDEVEVLAAAGAGTPPIGTRVSYPGSLTERMIEAGEPEVLAELSAIGESMAPYLMDGCAGCTGLVTPLVSERDTVGALVLLRAREERPFGDDEAVLARLLGALASVALRRVRRELQLREREERFRSLAENAAEAIITLDEEDNVLFVNPAAERIFGYTRDELLVMPFSKLVPERLRGAHQAGIRRYVTTGVRRIPWTGIELPGLHRSGREVPLEVTFGEFAQDGRRYFTGIMRDISDRVRLQEERRRLQESKARLIRGFGHDVKNPLGAADGHAALLEQGALGKLDARQLESVRRIRRTLRSALSLIDELVEMSRVEAGQIKLRTEVVDPASLAAEAAEDHRAAAEAAGLTLDVELPDPLPHIETDPERVRQILGNLLSNALKYTPSGGRVCVTVRRDVAGHAEASAPTAAVAFAVQDTGIGIAEEQQRFVFEEFSRLEPGETPGAGLGLAISRRLARLLGGDISVVSAAGQGSTFTLVLPHRPSASSVAHDVGDSPRDTHSDLRPI